MHSVSPSILTPESASTAPMPMPMRRILAAYALEAKTELVRLLRTPGLSIPSLLLPVPLYLFFGVVLAGPAIANKPGVANFLFVSWSVFATMMPALFGVGCVLAIERDAGLLRLKRALPAPPGAHIVAKILTAMTFAGLAVVSLIAAATLVGTISLSVGQLLSIGVVMILGAVPFAAIGLFIGAHVSASAAPAVANLIFLPMLWLSGLFIPLPKFLEPWVVVWPAFHLNQVATGAAGLADYSFVPPQLAAAVLVGLTVLCGGLAMRRLARKG
jgi:ABC-2 type transport system permease protein